VSFTDERSFVAITTDAGETLALADTAAHAPPAIPHPRLGSAEAVELTAADPEYPSALALLDALVAQGERPLLRRDDLPARLSLLGPAC